MSSPPVTGSVGLRLAAACLSLVLAALAVVVVVQLARDVLAA